MAFFKIVPKYSHSKISHSRQATDYITITNKGGHGQSGQFYGILGTIIVT